MKVDKKELPKSQLELLVEIEPKEYKDFLIKEAEKISEVKNIPGFRAGKAPYEIVKQHVGEMAILESALDEILKHFYFEIIKSENLEPISYPKIDIEKMAVDNPLVFKVLINLLPKIKLGDIEKISIKKEKIEATKEELKKAIDTLRENQVKEVIKDDIIKSGDRADVDFKVSIDGVGIDGGSETNYPLIIGRGQMIPGFEEQLVGKKKGEEIKFQLRFPKEYGNKMVANKLADFEITVKEVYERQLPETNDAWAKESFGIDTIKELEEKIKEIYLAEKERDADQKIEIEMMEKLIESSEIGEFGEEVVKEETKKMIEEFKHSMSHQGVKLEDYLLSMNKKIEDIEKEFEPQAIKRLNSSLIIREIISSQKFEATKEEMEAELQKIMEMYGHKPEAKKIIDSKENKEHVENSIINKKAVDYLRSKIVKENKTEKKEEVK